MMRGVDVLYSLPYIFLVILLLVMFQRSLVMLFVALGLVQWLTMARIVRGQVLSLKQQTFVEAARALGASPRAVLFRHIVPNTLGPVIVYTTLTVPAVILQEAFLSFLGLGVQPPAASWGTLVSGGAEVIALFPWLVIFPGLALSLTLLCFNFLGDGLRDALDPQDRRDVS
jgi:oligopeptide transport system permease protein